MVTIISKRIKLREYNIDDIVGVHDYASDPEVSQYMDWGPNTLKDTVEFVQKAMETQKENPRMKYEWAIEHPLSGLIGGCGITIIDKKNMTSEIGYCLNREYWGNGYGTEVARSLIDHCFRELEMHRIIATCDPENIGSCMVMEKNGMIREGRFRKNLFLRGEWRDTYIYSILEKEWWER
jgi:RimJ/RimL family protein N-acetyltransferase